MPVARPLEVKRNGTLQQAQRPVRRALDVHEALPPAPAIMRSMRIPAAQQWWRPFREIGGADVFHVDLALDGAREALAGPWLDDHEHARAARYVFPESSRRYTLLRAALRSLLCERLSCGNADLSFETADHGKPYAVVCGSPAAMHFNVSDSGRHGLIALASEGQIGIDVEERSDKRDLDGLAETVFGRDERAAMASAAGHVKVERFYRLGTVKEALVKALGTGLYLDVATFQVPASLLQGDPGAVFSFPHLPTVRWWVEDLGTIDFAAAIAHEMAPGRERATSPTAHAAQEELRQA
ncbi:MAG: 4'-phosphopantetheinyl transferase superfamily protein [Chloroflexi bacterium]|nr:4'-phosphopantetheinyl transferase superfamily protein [Chloroflexota bacterium]